MIRIKGFVLEQGFVDFITISGEDLPRQCY